jgi:hypothetical protein
MTEYPRHFADETWVDFVRDIADPAVAVSIRKHIEERCEECRRSWSTWSAVVEVASREHDYEPLPSIVNAVKSAFRRSRISLLDRLIETAKLVFDSYREPLPVGVRSGGAPARYMIHEWGPYVVDLTIDQEGGRTGWLAGQLSQKESAGSPFAGTAILLANKDKVVVRQTSINIEGEFQLEFEPQPDLTLYLDIPSAAVIAVPLPVWKNVSTALREGHKL